MGQVYKRSTGDGFSKYFEEQKKFEAGFNSYFFDEQIIKKTNIQVQTYQEGGTGGIPLFWNKEEDSVYIDQTDVHSLILGPTGSKKTRLIAMPMVRVLAEAGESIIISDPKAEIYNRTAYFLEKKGYHIGVLNLRAPAYSDGWNPLALPYQLYCMGEVDRAYEFANDIATNLMNIKKSQKDPFWDNSAGSFLFGLILLLFKYCKEFDKTENAVTLGNVLKLRNIMMSQQQRTVLSTIWEYAKKDEFIMSALIGTVETANDTRGGILSTFDEKMRSFSIQPNLMAMLSANSSSLMNLTEEPTAIFMIMPDEKTSYHALISLYIKQSYEYLIYQAQQQVQEDGIKTGQIPIRINYILDEFSSLPTISDFPSMITAARSRNIRFNLFIQSKHQLVQRYEEEADTIQANCGNWIFLTSREIKLLEELSSLCGKNRDGNPILPIPLLQRLNKAEGEALILSGRKKPYISFLPDINIYDKNKIKERTLNKQQRAELVALDYAELLAQSSIPETVIPNPFMDSTGILRHSINTLTDKEIDNMIKEIDKKIKALDEDEKNTKENQETVVEEEENGEL